jgi:Flp pilus assembly protein TadD
MTMTTLTFPNVPTTPATSRSRIPNRIEPGAPRVPAAPGQTAGVTNEQVLKMLQDLETWTANVHRVAAETYLTQSMYAEAIVHLEAACRFDADNAEYHNELGTLRYMTGDDEGALVCFDVAREIDRNNPATNFNRGMVLFGQGRQREAEECFAQATLADDRNAENWNNLGVVRFQLGKQEEARACFLKALQCDPQNADARANLSQLP